MEILMLETQRGKVWIVGDNCDYIEEHRAQGEGDRWFYDVIINEATEDEELCTRIRIFDPLEVRMIDGDDN